MRIAMHDRRAVTALARQARLDDFQLRRFRNAFYKKCLSPELALAGLPGAARELFAGTVSFQSLELRERQNSASDGATKLLLRTRSGKDIESVILRIGTGRVTLCVSSQAGCAVGCDFCSTGKLGLLANLTSGEILDQVVWANSILEAEGRKLRNIVFMGMGEPLHNTANLFEALEMLTATDGFHYAPQRITVSTVGIPEAALECVRAFPKVRMALSLHSAVQETRAAIVPLARRHTVADLRELVAALNDLQGEPVLIEYVLLGGVNDSAEERNALSRFLQGLSVHVNLIPFNPIRESPHLAAASRDSALTFAANLKADGFKVTLRHSLGREITAACGQLASTRPGT
jgi:23S rRNA (adenine2503-C2)-methyltransferase